MSTIENTTIFEKTMKSALAKREETINFVTEELGVDATSIDDFHQRLFAINKHVPQYTFIPGPDADPNDETIANALAKLPDFCSEEMSQILLNRMRSQNITDIVRRRMSVANNESKETGDGGGDQGINEGRCITDDYPFDATAAMSEIYNFAIYNSYRIRMRRDSKLNDPEIIEAIRPIFNVWSVDFVAFDDVDAIISIMCKDIYERSGVRAVADDFIALSNAPMQAGDGGMEPETEYTETPA